MLNIIIIIFIIILFSINFNKTENYASKSAEIQTYEKAPTFDPYWIRNNLYYYLPNRFRYIHNANPWRYRRFFGHYPYYKHGFRHYW